ncbi:MAG TPA: hypothetical protein VGA66_01590, partial [Mycobacterium sp.]
PSSRYTTSQSPPSAKTTATAPTPEILICAHRRRVVTGHQILGDGGYRGIPPITTPRPDTTNRIIRDDHYRAHRRIRARVEHVIARLKDRQIPRQCRRGPAINHSLQIAGGLWNLKTRKQSRINS